MSKTETAARFDVVAVNLETNRVRFMARNVTEANADATCAMAVWRRGVDTEFFSVVPSGKYAEGDDYQGR